MWTKKVYKEALKEYRNLEEEIRELQHLSFPQLFERYKGWSLSKDEEVNWFDIAYELLTVTIEKGADGIVRVSENIEIWGDENINKYELLTLEELVNKAE